MPQPLIECIPNFSEGRRPEIIEQILDAIRAVPDAILLNSSSDPDHNRTVVTFVGSPAAVEQAAFAAIAKAQELINLDQHHGEHPRIGATDVVPFVPIRDATMADCVEIARRLGKRVGEELGIAVYLYEKAATSPERENLAAVRSGEYEAWKVEIDVNPERAPDFGPAVATPAGATVIGARSPLIAWNVYLDRPDLAAAEKIGKAVRHLSGGLRFVKALGLLVEGQAQISMNLTNYRRTPVHRAVELVRREAARYGLSVTRSELVGLIPQQALTDSAAWYLQLDDFDPMQVLENRLAAAQAESAAPAAADADQFLEALATGTAAPGGGSAAAYAGAMAAGLAAMVARLTVNKKAYKDVEDKMFALAEQADTLRAELTAGVQEDAAAFGEVMAAFKLPKATEEEQAARAAAIETATLHAADVPLASGRRAVAVMALAVQAAELGNTNAISDAASGVALARASLTAAGLNVKINALGLQDKKKADELRAAVADLAAEADALEARLAAALASRGGLG
ncbi:MAG: glutamate formimidoyltransferase [Anaerolineae bacterium]|nr:MAG: glutamate formimidoyltransferase [Anaerolineae bacterium]